ncbi:MAG: hypothetical protein E6J11_15370 [Chloroflexi bacterium]|nr:MAG: hypothetical protein E6J11_15370 [Chloroflexota bacterium]
MYISPGGHYGLRGMLERIEATDGHLTLHSGKEQGTTIEVELPLAHSERLESGTLLLKKTKDELKVSPFVLSWEAGSAGNTAWSARLPNRCASPQGSVK